MLRLAALLIALCLAVPALAGRVALVIGNADYPSAGRLANAGHDAADMANRLTDLGFQVFAGENLTRAQMLALLDDFSDALHPDDLALFFYAGHGVQIGAENYIIPVDAVATDEVTLTAASVKLQTILRTMELRADRRIVILDACRNNPFVEKLAARGIGDAPKGLAKVEAGVGSYIAFSTQPENVALDGNGRNSPFTAALLTHMGDADSDIHAVMRRVRADVVAETGSVQVPWENSSLVEEVFLASGSPAPHTPDLPAQHAPGVGILTTRMFDPKAGGSECYVRRYSAIHLASHPQQRVTQIGVTRDLTLLDGGVDLQIEVRLRGDRVAQLTSYCLETDSALDCEIEGDAGNFRVEPAKDDALRLIVGARGIGLEDDQGFVTLRADRGDDRVFLIPPQDNSACAGFATHQ